MRNYKTRWFAAILVGSALALPQALFSAEKKADMMKDDTGKMMKEEKDKVMKDSKGKTTKDDMKMESKGKKSDGKMMDEKKK